MNTQLSGYISQNTDEKKAVELITSFRNDKYNRPDLRLFSNLLIDPVGLDGLEMYKGVYLGINILRQEFNLERKGRPGDFDILCIPFSDNKLFYECSAIFEVKIARPSSDNTTKGTNSVGEKQIQGLIEDGFPLIGLIHLCMPEPLKKEYLQKVKITKTPINMDWQPGEPPQPNLDDNWKYAPIDWLPHIAIHTQMKRIIRKGFPKYIGINAFSITQNPDKTHNIITSYEYRGFTSGYFNPYTSKATIDCIKTHFLKYGDKRYKKLDLNGNSLEKPSLD
jgi:hypothetical protein